MYVTVSPSGTLTFRLDYRIRNRLETLPPGRREMAGGRPMAERTRTQPMPMERMRRIYFMEQRFHPSDQGMKDTLYDSEWMRRFAGIELVGDAIREETTILRLRHLLERYKLTERVFEPVRGQLEQKRLPLRAGTIVKATIIEAPPSAKNEVGRATRRWRRARTTSGNGASG